MHISFPTGLVEQGRRKCVEVTETVESFQNRRLIGFTNLTPYWARSLGTRRLQVHAM